MGGKLPWPCKTNWRRKTSPAAGIHGRQNVLLKEDDSNEFSAEEKLKKKFPIFHIITEISLQIVKMMAAMNSGRVLVKQPAQYAAKSTPVVKTLAHGVFMGTNTLKQNVIRCRSANAASDVSPAVTNSPDPSFDGVADTYAVVDIGGHQLIVEEGRWYTVNRLEAEAGSTIKLGRVLALKSDGEFKVGQPYLENVNVEAQVLEDLKGPKVIVYKMKPKKHYRRTNGHRQPLTKILVTKIGA